MFFNFCWRNLFESVQSETVTCYSSSAVAGPRIQSHASCPIEATKCKRTPLKCAVILTSCAFKSQRFLVQTKTFQYTKEIFFHDHNCNATPCEGKLQPICKQFPRIFHETASWVTKNQKITKLRTPWPQVKKPERMWCKRVLH